MDIKGSKYSGKVTRDVSLTMRRLLIAGTRGIPACHGGFETFVEKLALFLTEKGWDITVYCQNDGDWQYAEDWWNGVRCLQVPVHTKGPFGSIVFDWKVARHAEREQILVLTLGYNTAIFSLLYRLRGVRNIINMDGLEWKRDKWGFFEKSWLYANEFFGCWLGNQLIADHPEIANHLERHVSRDKIVVIPYGAESIDEKNADVGAIEQLGLQKGEYVLVVARPEPENSILEIVRAFSQKHRGCRLVILGSFNFADNPYHQKVLNSASHEVLFPGAIYDSKIVGALRFFSRLYVHGHRVGGTNPSLVESLGAGAAVLANNNKFNRWVAGEGAHFFTDELDCARKFDELLENDQELGRMREASRFRFKQQFTWEKILNQYEDLLLAWLP